jgi:hypothetical protein
VALGLAALPASASTVAGVERAVTEGVTYERLRRHPGPVVVHVVRIDPDEASTIDVAAGGRMMGTFSRPSVIGRGHEAVVAINGDFGLLRGLPVHPFLMDGSLMSLGLQSGMSFSMSSNEGSSFLGPPRLAADVAADAADIKADLAEWNSGRPSGGQIAAFTRYGGDVISPPSNGCSVRLVPDGPADVVLGGEAVARDYVVGGRRCGRSVRSVPPNGVALASRRWGKGADALTGLPIGASVELSWSAGHPHVLDAIGGAPRLVREGGSVAPACRSRFCRRHPRTGVGVTSEGTVLLVVVDGRSRRSVGMTLRRFARTMRDLGAVDAMNLDGGGSSAMWIRGRGVVNRPSDDSGERPVVNAMLVLPGLDQGEMAMSGSLVAGALSKVRGGPGGLAATDPGSSGGLADALLNGSLGTGPIDPSLRRLAAAFRNALPVPSERRPGR